MTVWNDGAEQTGWNCHLFCHIIHKIAWQSCQQNATETAFNISCMQIRMSFITAHLYSFSFSSKLVRISLLCLSSHKVTLVLVKHWGDATTY